MKPISRRSLLAKGGLGAVSAAGVLSMPQTVLAADRSMDDERELTAAEREVLARPFIVHLRDAATGELELLVGEQSIVFTNRKLVAKVLRAAR